MKTKIFYLLLAGVALLSACSGRGSSSTSDTSYKVLNNNDKAISAQTDTMMKQAKLIKTGEIRFKVKDVQQTSEAIATLTTSYKGMVMHHGMSSNVQRSRDIPDGMDSMKRISIFNTVAQLTVKVPSEKLEEFMNQVNHMGVYVNERKMDTEDLSFDYQDTQLKLQSRRQIIDQQKSGRIVIKNPSHVMQLKDDIIDAQIENQKIDYAVKYSTVELSLCQSNTLIRESVINEDLEAYNPPFRQRAVVAFANGWAMFVDLLIGLTNIWIFILLGLAVWLGYIRYKRMKIAVKSASV